jgi:integrase
MVKARKGNAADGTGTFRRRPNGTWEGRVSLTDPVTRARRRVSVYGATKAEVVGKAGELLVSSRRGTVIPGATVTVAVVVNAWQEWAGGPKPWKESTTDAYRSAARHVVRVIGRRRVVALADEDVTRLHQDLKAKGYSPAYVNLCHRVLAQSLRYGQRKRLVAENVAVLHGGPGVPSSEVDALTAIEATALIVACEDEARYGPMILVALLTGIRSGELLGMAWSDITGLGTPTATLNLVEQSQRRRGRGIVREELKTPKSRRPVPLPVAAQTALEAWRKIQERERLIMGEAWPPGPDWVWTTPLGTPTDPRNFRREVQRVGYRIGIERRLPSRAAGGTEKVVGLHPHQLRHALASLAFDAGADIEEITELLGHSNSQITRALYIHLLEGRRRNVADIMDVVAARR